MTGSRLRLAIAVGSISGFIALSYEILWIRVYTFATEGTPESFGMLLSAYLAGLALGALVARQYCDRTSDEAPDQLFLVGIFFLVANVAAFLVVPLSGQLVGMMEWDPEDLLPFYAVAAAGLGTGFPLLAHFAIPADSEAGAKLSYLYVGNIIGSTLGSLLTGLVLLELLSLRNLTTGLVIAGASISCALIATGSPRKVPRVPLGVAYALLVVTLIASAPILCDGLYERLLYEDNYYPGRRFAHTVENRSGVVNMSESGTVYGGGSYDGQMNISPHPDVDDNRVARAYAIPAFHPAPREVLMIGLGAGSWLKVLTHLDEIEKITVIEINPGYVEMMRRTPLVASAVSHPKLEMIIDDGRRFLNHNDRQFDVIIQNTIVFWRSHASSLLSREYMELTAEHLKPGGIVYLNSTRSTAAQRTVATVFPYAMRYQNMMIAGFEPVSVDRERWRDVLTSWRIDGELMLDGDQDPEAVELIINQQIWDGGPTWEGREAILARTQNEPVITDDNMATEWWAWNTYPD